MECQSPKTYVIWILTIVSHSKYNLLKKRFSPNIFSSLSETDLYMDAWDLF